MYRKVVIGMFALLSLLTACAPQVEQTRKRFFWPPLSESPKIEYLGFIQSDYDVEGVGYSELGKAVFGRPIPEPLFKSPFDVYSDGLGVIYVSDTVEKKVFSLNLEKGTIDVLKDQDGNAFPFVLPLGVSGETNGKKYVVDSHQGKVLVFNAVNVTEKIF